MKTKLFSAALMSAMAVAALTSCDKNNDDIGKAGGTSIVEGGKISGTIVPIEGYGPIDRLVVNAAKDSGYPYDAETTVTNGEFSLTLPTPSDGVLRSVDKILNSGHSTDLTEVEINNTMGIMIAFRGYKDGNAKGDVYYEVSNNRYIEVLFVYVNKDIVINKLVKLSDEENTTWNINLKAGWNMILKTYTPATDISTLTTGNIPNNMRWVHAG